MTLTLTEFLTDRQSIRLYGRRIADLSPQGHLGLPLDPDGPVCFAAIRAYAIGQQLYTLPQGLVLSVYGEGLGPEPQDPHAQPDERCWQVRTTDVVLRVGLSMAPVIQQLSGAGAEPEPS